MWIDGEDVHQLKERENHSSCEGAFRQQHRIEGRPVFARIPRIQTGSGVTLHRVPRGEAEADPSHVKRVRDEINNVPQVRYVIHQSIRVKRSNLAPNQADDVNHASRLGETWQSAALMLLPLVEYRVNPRIAEPFEEEKLDALTRGTEKSF